jgi:hypothetical protein
MKRGLLLIALLVPSPARSDCAAFLIPPTARVTNDERATDVWREGRRDYTLAYAAAGGFIPSGPVALIDHSGFDNTWAACSTKNLIASKRTGLVKLWTKFGDGFRASWAKREDLIEISFSPVESMDASSFVGNRAAAARSAELARDRIVNASFKPPDIENQRTFVADFEKTWAALIETLSDERWQVESIDKGSGLVTTKPAIDQGGSTMVCATKLDEAHRTWLNVFAKKTDAGTRVKLNATFRAIRDDQSITCYSNGTLEKALFDAIEKHLKEQ